MSGSSQAVVGEKTCIEEIVLAYTFFYLGVSDLGPSGLPRAIWPWVPRTDQHPPSEHSELATDRETNILTNEMSHQSSYNQQMEHPTPNRDSAILGGFLRKVIYKVVNRRAAGLTEPHAVTELRGSVDGVCHWRNDTPPKMEFSNDICWHFYRSRVPYSRESQ